MNTIIRTCYHRFHALPEQTTDRVLFLSGLVLACGEFYKQLFLYYRINHGTYDWWFFPFQLCSLPMYLCLMLPLLPKGRIKTALCTFMRDFGLLGGIAALLVPEGFSHIHWSLTLHGYLWHLLLIFISFFVWLCGRADSSRRGFRHAVLLYGICCVIATLINVLSPGRGQADMFYISPYHLNAQPVFHQLSLRLGIWPANLSYLLTVCMGARLIHAALAAADALPFFCAPPHSRPHESGK